MKGISDRGMGSHLLSLLTPASVNWEDMLPATAGNCSASVTVATLHLGLRLLATARSFTLHITITSYVQKSGERPGYFRVTGLEAIVLDLFL